MEGATSAGHGQGRSAVRVFSAASLDTARTPWPLQWVRQGLSTRRGRQHAGRGNRYGERIYNFRQRLGRVGRGGSEWWQTLAPKPHIRTTSKLVQSWALSFVDSPNTVAEPHTTSPTKPHCSPSDKAPSTYTQN